MADKITFMGIKIGEVCSECEGSGYVVYAPPGVGIDVCHECLGMTKNLRVSSPAL